LNYDLSRRAAKSFMSINARAYTEPGKETMPNSFAAQYLRAQEEADLQLDSPSLAEQIAILEKAYLEDRQIIVFGNGGSASTASHFVCDLGKGASVPGLRRFRILSVNDNMAVLTAYGNDNSYEDIFSEALKNYLRPGDVVIGITASGNSPNVLKAMEVAKAGGATTLGWIGFGGGKLKGMVDSHITLDSRNYGVVECAHMILHHIIAQWFMKRLPELAIKA
jgi:D-sedoheptulose 7-phosphate isomerase